MRQDPSPTNESVNKEATSSRVYDFVAQFVEKNGYSPSLREISSAVGVTPSTVLHHLRNLASHGRVTFVPGRFRTYRVNTDSQKEA